MSPGAKFREAVEQEDPLQIVGAVNAYAAILAEHTGYRALYLSGAGVANASFGLPDIGITTFNDVLTDAERITNATQLPLLVDIDTGWGSAFSIARAIKAFNKAGVAAVHIEDQESAKRCGHRPNKQIVSTEEMCDRIKAAVDARLDDDFVVMARTDAIANEGLKAGIERAIQYVEAGADMIFAEAITELSHYSQFCKAVSVPVLANITEFGKTPMLTVEQLADAGVAMALYPLSAFRAMNAAALNIYETIRHEGTQQNVVDAMQTRTELYDFLNYHHYERKLDELYSQEDKK